MVTLDEALEKIATVEGEAWLVGQRTAPPDAPCTLAWARRRHEARLALVEAEPDPAVRAALLRQTCGAVIDGRGGWHRYSVRGDGAVVYLAGFGRRDVKRARAAGFDVAQ